MITEQITSKEIPETTIFLFYIIANLAFHARRKGAEIIIKHHVYVTAHYSFNIENYIIYLIELDL